ARRPEPPGAAHVRRGRPSGRSPPARRDWTAARRAAEAGTMARADRRRSAPPAAGDAPARPPVTRLGALLLAAAIAVQAGAFIANSSGTVDETVYLRQAESTYQRHDNTALATQGVAPLPIMLFYALPALARVPDYAQAILLA